MQANRSWLALLGAVSLRLLAQVSAESQVADPNLAVIREFNTVLTDNTKLYDIGCCMDTDSTIGDDKAFKCFLPEDMALGETPGAKRVGLQFCHHLPDTTPDQATDAFKVQCSQRNGEWIEPDQRYCPQKWENYDPNYKKKTPPPAVQPTPEEPKPQPKPDKDGKGTNDPDGFKTEGTFHYTLVDYAITRSLACCKASNKPIVKPNKYQCAQRKATKSVFMKQCAKILVTITKAQKASGFTTINGDSDVVDEATKKQCSTMWTNAITYTYGFCQLDYDFAVDDATKAFSDDCTALGGELKDPHFGMCLWNVDDAAGDSSTTSS